MQDLADTPQAAGVFLAVMKGPLAGHLGVGVRNGSGSSRGVAAVEGGFSLDPQLHCITDDARRAVMPNARRLSVVLAEKPAVRRNGGRGSA